jgi:hypothetical protein
MEEIPNPPSVRSSEIRMVVVWLGLALALIGALTAAVFWAGLPDPPAQPRVLGVALGMTSDQVQAGFQGSSSGTWTTSSSGDELILRWKRTGPDGELPVSVAFEFHSDALVVVRAEVGLGSALARGDAIESTPAELVARTGLADGGVDVVILARDCSRNTGEVARLLAQSQRRGRKENR